MTKQEILAKEHYDFEDFKAIVECLRAPDGCPWDRAQTHESMTTNLIEECYEVIEAINNKDTANLREELGDVMLQVVMHSQIASEDKEFTLEDVIDEVAQKLVRRHPHVFVSGVDANTANEGRERWDAIKKAEKAGKIEETRPLRSVPHSFPACVRAQKVLKKASKEYGYDSTADTVLSDIQIILDGLSQTPENTELIQKMMLKNVQLCALLGLNAEKTLTNATEQFINNYES